MPPDRTRTVNAQGRQKSCAECAKAKRRCDLQQPSCFRCIRQNLACNYPPQPHSHVHTPGTPSSQSNGGCIGVGPIVDAAEATSFPFDPNIPTIPTTSDVELLDFNFTAVADSVDILNEMLNDSSEDTEDLSIGFRNYLPGKVFSSAHLSYFAQSRTEYSIEQLKLAPRMMIEENATPWSHAKLYEESMPKSLQDAHAACALYILRNDKNSTYVVRRIIDSVKSLIDVPLPTAPSELLARAHALILYQIMLVFGGDIRYYGQADSLVSHMEETGIALHSVSNQNSDPEGSLPIYPGTAARQAWSSFILRESTRRTVLIMFYFVAMCNLLRGRLGSCVHSLVAGNRVTLSAHLWNAKNAFDFAVTWNERKHFLVKELDFTDVLDQARPDDVDVFGRMTMVGLMGVDDVKGWFYTRGGTF